MSQSLKKSLVSDHAVPAMALLMCCSLAASGCAFDMLGSASGHGNGYSVQNGAVQNGATNSGSDSTESLTTSNQAVSSTHSIDIQTTAADFSATPVVTDPTTVSAVLLDSFDFRAEVSRFKVSDDSIVAYRSTTNLDNDLVIYDIASKTIVDTHLPDAYLSGFDYNGGIMTVDGGQNLNFYHISNGEIQDAFYHVEYFNHSKFLSECFLDDDIAYVFNADKLLSFPLSDSTQLTQVSAIDAFAYVRLAADETQLFISMGGYKDSRVRVLDKIDHTERALLSYPGRRFLGLSVDANYIYLADALADEILVLNKHTQQEAGRLAVPSTGAIQVVDDILYASNPDAGSVDKYQLAYTKAP